MQKRKRSKEGLRMAKTAFPSIFYVYGNKTYEEDIKAYLMANFNTTQLNLSSSTGCGFKIESYDIGDLKRLDIILESFEGWIQQTRRTEFSDLETNFLDLDKYIAGCNNRITTDRLDDLNFILNSHKGVVVLRTMNFLGGALSGSYKILMAKDSINGSVPINASVSDNRLIKKTIPLISSIDTSFFMTVTNCSLTGVIAEYHGVNDVKNWELSNPFFPSIPAGNVGDENVSTFIDYPYDNYPRCIINRASGTTTPVLKWCIYFEIVGTSGDTFKFHWDFQGGFNALTGDSFPFIKGYNAGTGQHFNFTDTPMNAFPENQRQFIELECDFKAVTQLKFSLDSVEHPTPAFPAPVPVMRVYELLIKTA